MKHLLLRGVANKSLDFIDTRCLDKHYFEIGSTHLKGLNCYVIKINEKDTNIHVSPTLF